MNETTRRDFLRRSAQAAGAVLATQALGGRLVFAEVGKKLKLNVGYLPIMDHLILPVSHALDNARYKDLSVRQMLCKSWDEMTKRIDMGVLQAAFLLTPLAMQEVVTGSSLRCVLLGHTDGSVIAVKKSITDATGLVGKTLGIPHVSSTHTVLLYKYLQDHEIEMKDAVELTTVAPPLTAKSLKAGRIDGYCVAEPWGMKGVNAGTAAILEFSKNIMPGHVCCIVMVKKQVLEAAPDAIAEWVKSLQAAGKSIHADTDRAATIQKAYMKHEPKDIAQVIVREMVSYAELTPKAESFRAMHDLALKCGALTKECDLEEFVDDRFAF